MQILNLYFKKVDRCKNNLKKSTTIKVGENIRSDFSMSTILSFRDIKNKNDVCRCEGCMKALLMLKKACKEDKKEK